eukprot:TRINITY_DN32368_c0_g1_i1.p1 TRINITY_DN32368_c0_g1~~TRINITY_DN32368_c0_g1_i1.p1  ORF type:complete len:583 (+),score=57.41 TRINITY_DN32368_c0_g1_i1:119-1867(+)
MWGSSYEKRSQRYCSAFPWLTDGTPVFALQGLVRTVNDGFQEIKCHLERLSIQRVDGAIVTKDEEEPNEAPVHQSSHAPRVISLAQLERVGIPRPMITGLDRVLHAMSNNHVLFPSLKNFIGGYDMGVTSLAIMQLTDPHLIGGGWPVMSTWEVGVIASCKLYGAFGGSVVAFNSTSDLSSRDILIVSACGFTVVALASALAPSSRHFMLARIIAGMLEGVSSPALIAYTTETSEPHIRDATIGARIGMYGLGTVVGTMVGAALVNIPGGWHLMLGATGFPAAAMAVGMLSLPHSPRWLLRQSGPVVRGVGRRERALQALKNLRSTTISREGFENSDDCYEWEQQLQVEIDTICSDAPGPFPGDKAASSLSMFVRHPATWTTFAVILFKNGCGSVAMSYYSASVLASLGCGHHFAILAGGLAALRWASLPVGAVLVGRMGARGTMLLGSLGATASMAGLYMCQSAAPLAPTLMSVASVLCLALNTASFEISFGTVSHQLAADLFSQELRQRGLAWTHLCNYPLKGTCVQLFPLILAHAGPAPTWAILTGVNLLGFVAVFRLVPETSGKSLEDIGKELRSPPL